MKMSVFKKTKWAKDKDVYAITSVEPMKFEKALETDADMQLICQGKVLMTGKMREINEFLKKENVTTDNSLITGGHIKTH